MLKGLQTFLIASTLIFLDIIISQTPVNWKNIVKVQSNTYKKAFNLVYSVYASQKNATANMYFEDVLK